ncbi:MAG TPA: hypothetical protein VLJ14_09735, partial [Ktedonobacterales bacterium]|nr:hypothetical protein [Ktedonobacterales bacterium]
MLSGRFLQAWCESDAIAARGTPDPHRFWDGLPFTGKRVLVRCLHGFGDAIQFVRYAQLLRREASRVIVQTHPELVPLIRGAACVDEAITWSDEDAVEWDQQIEVMELPRAFRTTAATIPRDIPYLSLPPAALKRAALGCRPGPKPRIGLQWGSSGWNPERSMHLDDLQPLIQFPEFEFYTLQHGPYRDELQSMNLACRVHDISTPEIVDAAASLLHLDLLITVDTMLAHLAGALGKPVWLMLHYEA